MNMNDLKIMMEMVFKQAYQQGREDMLDGIHISSNVLFQQFIENNISGFESPHLKSSILQVTDIQT